MITKAYHYVLSHVFYFLGDIACRINSEQAANFYQYIMKKSLFHDEKNGFKIWKEV